MLKGSVREFGPGAINNVLFLELFPCLKCGTSLLSAARKAVLDKFGAMSHTFSLHLGYFCGMRTCQTAAQQQRSH